MKTAKCCQQWLPVLRRRRRWPCPSGGICHPYRTFECHNPRLWSSQRGAQPRSTWALSVMTCPQGSCGNSGNVCPPINLYGLIPFPKAFLPSLCPPTDAAARRGSQEVPGWLTVGAAPGSSPKLSWTTATWLSLSSAHRACAVRFS